VQYETFDTKGKYAYMVVKKRNVNKSLLPTDYLTVDSAKYVIQSIAAHDKNLLITMRYVSGRRTKFKHWLVINRENFYIQIANSFEFSNSTITEQRHGFMHQKYEFLMTKEVAKEERLDNVVRLWLK